MDAAQFDVNVAMEERHWWFTARREIMRAIVQQLAPPHTGKTVVDIGCGTGANIASLADAYRAIGTDASPDAIERAQRRFSQAEFHCTTDAAQLAKYIAEADVVTCMDVMEHVPDDFALLSSLLAAARPGTHLLLTVPAMLSLWSGHDEALAHYRRYDADRFARVWQGLPVECLMLSYFNARLYPLVKAIRNTNALLGRTSGVQGTDLKVPAAPINRTLHRIFLGERPRLLRLLQQNSATGYRRGVSLIAVLRRDQGESAARTKPVDIEPDYFDPVAQVSGGKMNTIIVVPCYNEAQRLDADAFVEHARRESDQHFLFVDDGSRDATWDVLQKLCARLPDQFTSLQLAQNSGKAEAVRQGMLAALQHDAEIVGYWDADLATPLASIAPLREEFRARPQINIVMGSRVKLLGRAIERKLARHYIGRVFATLASFILQLPVYDTQCGAKLFRASDVVRGLFATPFRTTWVFDVELLGRYVQFVGPEEAQASIVECPLHAWIDVPGSKLRLHHGLKAAWDLLLIRRLYTSRAALCEKPLAAAAAHESLPNA